MFDNNEDEYKKATQDAQVNIYDRNRGKGFLILLWNLFLLLSFLITGYFAYNYIKNETTLFNDTPIGKTVVMGVSETKSDTEYLEMLNSIDIDNLEQKKELSLSDAMNDVVNTSTLRDDSLYTQAISKEIDSNTYHANSRVIFVEKGDTLGSISEKYYGSPAEFNKIIDANKNLDIDYQVIHVGQKLNVPY